LLEQLETLIAKPSALLVIELISRRLCVQVSKEHKAVDNHGQRKVENAIDGKLHSEDKPQEHFEDTVLFNDRGQQSNRVS
jgi:hypothetical protein